jgi:hypothetical protein
MKKNIFIQNGGFASGALIKLTELIAFIISSIYWIYRNIIFNLILYIGIPFFIIGCVFSGGFTIGFIFLLIGGFYLYKKYFKVLIEIKPSTMYKTIQK